MIMRLATLFLLAGLSAWAACSGSGVTWSCTAGSTVANVNSAISSASNNATITFEPGSYAWNSAINLSTTKGVTLKCATVGACNVSASGLSFSLVNWTGTRPDLYRISGFNFNNPSAYHVWFYQYLQTGKLSQIRIDNNKYTMTSGVTDLIVFGENAGASKTTVNGVIDHNTFITTNGQTRAIVHYGSKDWVAGLVGSANNLYIEDNVFDNSTMTNAGLALVDGNGGVAWVIRYNSFRNGRIEHHGYYNGGTGFMASEVYGNTVTMDNVPAGVQYLQGDRAIKHQGSGEWIVFNNTIRAATPHSSGVLFQNYRSSSDWAPQCNGSYAGDGNRQPQTTYAGYPCLGQLGRDVNAALKPMYFWNNKWSDTGASITPQYAGSGANDLGSRHLVNNRDYYVGGSTAQTSPASPFNGTTGMGFGTLSNRPTTCTTNANESGGGVGYFATDSGPQGTLYRCSASNTWTVHYTPYTYPHPLQASAGAVPPVPPSNLVTVVR